MFFKIILAYLMGTGIVEPMDQQNDGRKMYNLYVLDEQKDVVVFEHAYKEEIIEYIKTGEFKYNDFLYEAKVNYTDNEKK